MSRVADQRAGVLMVNRAIELHASRIEGIVEVACQAILVLRAYIHQSEGKPGWDSGTGWVQAVALAFSDAEIDADRPEMAADIYNGDLLLGDRLWKNMFPIPLQPSGAAMLRVSVTSGQDLVVRGSGLVLTLLSEPEYVEEFPGAA